MFTTDDEAGEESMPYNNQENSNKKHLEFDKELLFPIN